MRTYTTNIIPYLNIISHFDNKQIQNLERELIHALKLAGSSEARYRRFKTDREGKHPLYHYESVTLYNFFREKFELELAQTKNNLLRKRLEAWMPQSELELYYPKQMVAA